LELARRLYKHWTPVLRKRRTTAGDNDLSAISLTLIMLQPLTVRLAPGYGPIVMRPFGRFELAEPTFPGVK
jgi:hypothetical protein